MSKSAQKTHRSIYITLVLTALLFSSLTVFATSGGQWVESFTAGSCPQGQICAEWEEVGVVTQTCCIEPKFLGSNNANACLTDRTVNE